MILLNVKFQLEKVQIILIRLQYSKLLLKDFDQKVPA